MDFTKVPIGFGMELAQNEAAMARYAGLSQQEKQAVLDRAIMPGQKRRCGKSFPALRPCDTFPEASGDVK